MVMTTQSSPCKYGLRRSASWRCFCASMRRSRCCCCMKFCCSSVACCRRPVPRGPCDPPSPPRPPPSPDSCRESASRCSGDRPCRICKPPSATEPVGFCALARSPRSRPAAESANNTVSRNKRDCRDIQALQGLHETTAIVLKSAVPCRQSPQARRSTHYRGYPATRSVPPIDARLCPSDTQIMPTRTQRPPRYS